MNEELTALERAFLDVLARRYPRHRWRITQRKRPPQETAASGSDSDSDSEPVDLRPSHESRIASG